MSLNVCTFSGRLGKDAVVKQMTITGKDTTVANFSVAVDVGYGDMKDTLWLNCALWGKRAEGGLPRYLIKGQLVGVNGNISLRKYQGEDGVEKSSLEMRVSEIQLLGSKQDENTDIPFE